MIQRALQRTLKIFTGNTTIELEVSCYKIEQREWGRKEGPQGSCKRDTNMNLLNFVTVFHVQAA